MSFVTSHLEIRILNTRRDPNTVFRLSKSATRPRHWPFLHSSHRPGTTGLSTRLSEWFLNATQACPWASATKVQLNQRMSSGTTTTCIGLFYSLLLMSKLFLGSQ